jgi:hypothetical protein
MHISIYIKGLITILIYLFSLVNEIDLHILKSFNFGPSIEFLYLKMVIQHILHDVTCILNGEKL